MTNRNSRKTGQKKNQEKEKKHTCFKTKNFTKNGDFGPSVQVQVVCCAGRHNASPVLVAHLDQNCDLASESALTDLRT